MRTFDDVIRAFGGPASFARAIGIEPFHGQTMKTRGSIPPKHWPAVEEAAERLNIEGISKEVLADMAIERDQRQQERAAS